MHEELDIHGYGNVRPLTWLIGAWPQLWHRGFIQDHLKYHASFLTGVLRWCPDADHPLAPSVYSVDPQSELRGGILGQPIDFG